MTTNNETTNNTGTKSTHNGYPHKTKKEIVAQLATDDSFVNHCLLVLYARQTEHEQERKTTESRNARGFMSSHAVRGSVLAQKLQSGDALTADEQDQARAITGRYVKQLAEHFRQEDLARDPEIAAKAAVFFTAQ